MAAKRIVSFLFVLLLLLVISAKAQAHFVYVYGEDGKAIVVFGEGLAPDQAKFLSGMKSMKAFTTVDSKQTAVEFEKKTNEEEGWYETPLRGSWSSRKRFLSLWGIQSWRRYDVS